MIPLVWRFIGEGYRVILGGSGKSGVLLKDTFPDLTFIPLPSPEIRYAARGRWLIWTLISQMPAIIASYLRERRMLQDIIIAYKVDIVISDNRYGLYSKHARCILVTHQVSPVLPVVWHWAEYPLYLIIRKLIHQFDECWIPDYPDPLMNLSGKLSHRYKLPRNARYVGILSRFKSPQRFQGMAISDYYDVVFVLSGPEPQLGILFHICKAWADHAGKKTLIISGYHHKEYTSTTGNSHVRIVPHLDSVNFRQALVSAGVVICRSGYSAIMDLITLGKTAILIPTPGQTEQEYLADSLSKKGLFRYIKQHKMEDARLCQYINDLQISNASKFFPDQDEMSIPFLSNEEHR